MVQIPTTKRKYYNTTAKTNTLAAYAEALKPAMQNAQQIFMDQQKIKIQTNATKARIEADDYVNNMRLQYQGNPDSPEFKQAIQGGLDDIFNRYGDDIDPIARGEWNLTANKLSGAYELSNNEWIISQRAQNAKLDVAENINANLNLARRAGINGNWQAGVADYKESYAELFDYAKKNMGETNARALLKDYEQQYMTSFINGMAESNPAAAMKALENPEILDMVGDEQAQRTIKQLVKKQKTLYDHNNKVRQVNLEFNLSEKLDSLPATDALQLLRANEDNVSKKYYKAKTKALLSNLGITAETQEDEAAEILMNIAALNKEDVEEYYKKSQDILADIEERYAEGRISTADRKRLMTNVLKGQGKNIQALKDEGSGIKFWQFSYKDANEFIENNYAGKDKNKILLEYFRQVNQNDDLDDDHKAILLKSMVMEANGKLARINYFGRKVDNNNDAKIKSFGWKVRNGLPSFDNKEDARKAFESGRLKKGDAIYINGQYGVI